MLSSIRKLICEVNESLTNNQKRSARSFVDDLWRSVGGDGPEIRVGDAY